MKKLLFLFSFLLGFAGFASAQQASAKQVKLRDAAAQAVANNAKMDMQKKAMLNKTSDNIVMGADQAASEAMKARKTATK